MKKLLKNATALVGEELEVVTNCYIGVEGSTIVYVSKEPPTEHFDDEIDLSNHLIMPGLVNAHTHSPMVLLRNVGGGLNLQEWLFDNIFPIEDKLTGNDIRVGTKLAMMEMLSTGTVSFSDMYMFPSEEIEEVQKAGMKVNIPRPVICFDENEEGKDNVRLQEAIALYDNFHDSSEGRIKIDFSLHAEYTVTEKVVASFSKEMQKRQAHLHVHVSETKKEHLDCIEKYGKTPTSWLNDLGALETTSQFAHGVWLEEADLNIIQSKGVTVVHNPTSNMKLGSGFADIPKMNSMGINITIGTDGTASNNNLNMFEEMHLAALIHKGKHNDPTVLPAKEVIKMATSNGMKMQGRFDSGVIEVGKKADIIAIDFKKPHLTPNINYYESLVYAVQGSDVTLTMVDGRILYKDGVFPTIDAEETYQEVASVVERLYGESNGQNG